MIRGLKDAFHAVSESFFEDDAESAGASSSHGRDMPLSPRRASPSGRPALQRPRPHRNAPPIPARTIASTTMRTPRLMFMMRIASGYRPAKVLPSRQAGIGRLIRGARTFHSVLCVPSQKGGLPVCLHWHKATCLLSAMENSSGANSVPV